MKFKSKISYLGKKISILPWQMAEQLAVEVDVKNVTDGCTYGRRNTEHGQAPLYYIFLETSGKIKFKEDDPNHDHHKTYRG